jgi:large subunit ribosomal protein L35e
LSLASQTRAIRRRLSPSEAGKKTLKQTKKDKHFRQKVYAVKA